MPQNFVDNEILFSNLFNDILQSLQKIELYASSNAIKEVPAIFRTEQNNRRMVVDTRSEKILNYVKVNLIEHIKINKLRVNIIDRTKILYWVGMYIFEELNSPFGIKFLQAQIIEDIYQDCGVEVDSVMCDKANDLANEGKDIFLKYYGRLGLYYSLKHIHRTVGDL